MLFFSAWWTHSFHQKNDKELLSHWNKRFFQSVVSALRCLCIELHPGMCEVVRRPRRWVFRKRMSYWNSFCNPYAGIIVYSSIRRAVNTPEWLRTQLEYVFSHLERHSPRHILIIFLFGVYQENVFIAKSFIRLLRGIDNFKDENAGKQLDSISRVGRVFLEQEIKHSTFSKPCNNE